MQKRSWAGLGLVVAVAVCAGFWLGRSGAPRGSASVRAEPDTPDLDTPFGSVPVLQAATATNDDSFAVATGRIDEDVEGFFTLDFLTGELQCVVMNYRIAKLNAVFKTNVLKDLGVDQEKAPKYLMATAEVDFPRGGTIARPAQSVVYVLDTVTGNFAAYGLPWRRELAAAGRPQLGVLQLLDVGRARTAALRE